MKEFKWEDDSRMSSAVYLYRLYYGIEEVAYIAYHNGTGQNATYEWRYAILPHGGGNWDAGGWVPFPQEVAGNIEEMQAYVLVLYRMGVGS